MLGKNKEDINHVFKSKWPIAELDIITDVGETEYIKKVKKISPKEWQL